ncbi:MAG: T9SS type A sorting domain-containing protein [Bacteroidales bacterium]
MEGKPRQVFGVYFGYIFQVLLAKNNFLYSGTYQWYRDNVLLTGETNATYSDLWEAAGAHSYYCEYTTGAGTTQSNTVTVTWKTTTITISADYTLLPVGASVNLTATVGTSGGTYQWFRDGVAISGATSSTYRDTPTSAQTYNYTCTYTIGTASVSSNSVQVEWRVLAISISADATSVQTGTTVTLTASITVGLTGGRYVWYKNGTAISGSNTYQITDVSSSATTNTYYCTYMLNGVTATSNSVSVTWTAPLSYTASLYFNVTIQNNYIEEVRVEGNMDNGSGTNVIGQNQIPGRGTGNVTGTSANFTYNPSSSYNVTLRVDLYGATTNKFIQNYNFGFLTVVGKTTGTVYGNYALTVTGGGAGDTYISLAATTSATAVTEDVRFEIVGSIETQQ